MVKYFESYESVTNTIHDWGYSARMVFQFFYQLQRAAQSPNDGIKFRGSTRVLLIGSTSFTTRSSHTVWMPSVQSP